MTLLPDIWGRGGALFAFSGMDGPTEYGSRFVGSTLCSPGGILFHSNPPVLLEFSCEISAMVRCDLVASDCISLVFTAGEAGCRIFLSFMDKDTIIGSVGALQNRGCLPLSVRLSGPNAVVVPESRTVIVRTETDEFALVGNGHGAHAEDSGLRFCLLSGQGMKFVLAYSGAGGESCAVKKANRALSTDTAELLQRRICFFRNLPKPEVADPLLLRTYYKCASVQKVNCCTSEGEIAFNWTTPDRWPHRNMWLWDSAFHALGLRHFAPEWAKDAIRAVLSKQSPDGFIPHMMGPYRDIDSLITQPPILSWATWQVYTKTGDVQFLEFCYPKLKAMVLCDCENLDRDNSGPWEWESGGASGMDNSPRFDEQLGDAVDLCSYIANELRYLQKMAEVLSLNEDKRVWSAMRHEISKLINERMWDDVTGFYYDLTPDGQKLMLKTVAGFTPLFAGICTKEQAMALVSHLIDPREFWRPMPVPSVSVDELSFSDDMWRGPVWVNYNCLVIQGLLEYGYLQCASELRKRTLKEVAHWYAEDGVIYEFYDSERLKSPCELMRKGKTSKIIRGAWVDGCIRDYHWTAAVYVDLIFSQYGE